MYIYEKLLQNKLFQGLDKHTVRKLLEEISYFRRTYRKKEIIAGEGDKVNGLLLLLRGCVTGEMLSQSGKVVKIEKINEGHALAAAFLFGSDNYYPVNIISDTETECVFLRKHSLMRLLKLNEKVMKNYLDMISEQAQFLSAKIRFLVMQNIKGKIAHYLLEKEKDSKGENIYLSYSQTDLSELFGVTRPALSRALRQLHVEGILVVEGKHIFIKNKTALRKLLD